MVKPALVAVHGDPALLATLDQDLGRRFGADYQVRAVQSPGDALAVLAGVEFLCRAHVLHPAAKRMLFITYGDPAAAAAGLQAMALGQLDHYLNAP